MTKSTPTKLLVCYWNAVVLSAAGLSCSGHQSNTAVEAETPGPSAAEASSDTEGPAVASASTDSEQAEVVPQAEPEREAEPVPMLSGPVLSRRSDDSPESGEPKTCPAPPGRGIAIHVFTKVKSAQQVKKLAEMLAADGFTVRFTDTAANGNLLVAIEGDLARFKRVFKLRLVNTLIPMSAFDGWNCQLYVKGYSLPKRYRRFVDALNVPDPILY